MIIMVHFPSLNGQSEAGVQIIIIMVRFPSLNGQSEAGVQLGHAEDVDLQRHGADQLRVPREEPGGRLFALRLQGQEG